MLAVADVIAALGRAPELAEPLPFTRTSAADVLRLDDVVTDELLTALAGTDLEAALDEVAGIDAVEVDGNQVSFAYDQVVSDHKLELAYDDGGLRFGANDGAGTLSVSLQTPSGNGAGGYDDAARFVVEVDEAQADPLLRFALVSQPELELEISIDSDDIDSGDDALTPFTARQGFTEVDIDGDTYSIDRTSDITLRDPNGRDLLTLEDLRYSNLVDLYRIKRKTDTVDIAFDVALPTGITVEGGEDDDELGELTLARPTADDELGELALAGSTADDDVWPDAADAMRTYGKALDALTGLSLVDGVTALAEYTGASLVLQDAADVDFPNLGGGVSDLFAPADELLDLLATSAVAEIRCGLTPENPPAGGAAPGDVVHCDAVTAEGLGEVTSAVWTVADDGSVATTDTDDQTAAAGPRPSGTVQIDGSDGQPDVVVELTFKDGTQMTARSLPRTIQDVTGRIGDLTGSMEGTSSATVNLTDDRLDVDVDLTAATASTALPVGDASTLGSLVGLTGLRPSSGDGRGGTATAEATNASFDVGFGIPLNDEPAEGDDPASIVLLPSDASLFEIGELSIDQTKTTGLSDLVGRVGFLGVDVDVSSLSLGSEDDTDPVVALSTSGGGTDAIGLDALLTPEGTLATGQVTLTSTLTAAIAFTATEQEISSGTFATGVAGGASGAATVSWAPGEVPSVTFTEGYQAVRIFDPVPAAFLTGTAKVTGDAGSQRVDIDVDTVTDLFAALQVPNEPGIEVARSLVAPGVACQNVTLVDADTLTCEGLAPEGTSVFPNGASAEVIILGDPFALRDGIIEGLAGTLNELQRLDDDNQDHAAADDRVGEDQYRSTLPLVDLTPGQLALEREDLAAGVAALVEAATDDEDGRSEGPAVSSAQELSGSVQTLFGSRSSLDYLVGTDALDVAVSASSASGSTLSAPLRFTEDSTGQVVSDDTVTVGVKSTSTLATAVAVATARPAGSVRTATTSTATIATDTPFTGSLRAGVAELTAAEGSTLALDVTVKTSQGSASGLLETAVRSGDGAVADLVIAERDDDFSYTAEPWESSGGEGAEQPAPDPMQIRFLAEGLDGFGAALGRALDGASPRVTGLDGIPVSAPLIGSDLDAGADVAGTLTGLTSALRDQYELVDDAIAAALVEEETTEVTADDALVDEEVTADQVEDDTTDPLGDEEVVEDDTTDPLVDEEVVEDDTADPLGDEEVVEDDTTDPLGDEEVVEDDTTDPLVEEETEEVTASAMADEEITAAALVDLVVKATEDALEATADVEGSDPKVTVTCSDDCEPCDAEDEGPCTTDGPTAWDTVSVSTTLTVAEQNGELPFSLGLEGINVRSDQPIETTTSWTVPVTIELVRGVGPRISIDDEDTLELSVKASIPDDNDLGDLTDDPCSGTGGPCLPAIIGYLPGTLTAVSEGDTAIDTTVVVTPDAGTYDLFELYDGIGASSGFDDPTGKSEDGIVLGFETFASDYGSFDLSGRIHVPWTAADGFSDVTYQDVSLDVGEVVAAIATPFDVVDPYLGPARDVIDVLRTPIPVVNDLSQLVGGDAISLLSLLEAFQGQDSRLDLAIRISTFLESSVQTVGAAAEFAEENVLLEDLTETGALLTIQPSEVALASSCTQTTRTNTTRSDGQGGTTSRTQKSVQPCPQPGTAGQSGARDQTTDDRRRGDRSNLKNSVGTSTKSITGSTPGFSLPFLADPNQIVDVLTGEGEASYFRFDFGVLQAEVAYTQKFGPIMAGPVPITPFVGGSIGVEGRLAVGFDSLPQTLAVRSVPDGDIGALMVALDAFEEGDVLREGFYLDDLDATGVDVPEVKLVTTLEAGAGVTIGIVTAGLKGGVTLTINLDLNDPNGDGRVRTAEIRDGFGGDIECLFAFSATLQAFLQVFFEVELLVSRESYAFDILRLGPYSLFEYACEEQTPTLVVKGDGDDPQLLLTSGTNDGKRLAPAFRNIAEDYEVRQFDTGGGADGGGTTVFEIDALSRVQRVEVEEAAGSGYDVRIYKAGAALSTTVQETFNVASLAGLGFLAEGNDGKDDRFSFLLGETFDADGNLLSTPFTTSVTLKGNGGQDILITGDGDDDVSGGAGNDSISTGGGDDVIDGGAGDDTVDAGPGLDDVAGGAGDDRLQGGPGADRIDGGAGNDALLGGPGRDVRALLLDFTDTDRPSIAEQVALGFDSGDVLVGGAGADLVDGGDGSDIVVGGGATNLVTATLSTLFEDGSREVNVIRESDRDISTQDVTVTTAVVPGPATLDTLCASGVAETGDAGGDRVTGGPEDDIVIGGDGPDRLDGGGGDDELCGRAGDDDISGDGGATGADAGDDVIRGGHGNDLIDAGPGDDVLFGDDVDLFREGARLLDGSLGAEASGSGDDADASGSGDDYLTAGDGDDILAGGGGSDLLRGGDGDDRVYGEGRDTTEEGGDAPALEDRLIACNPTTRIVAGMVDLNGDLLAGAGDSDDGVVADTGRLAGLEVVDGRILTLGSTEDLLTGLLGGETVVLEGKVDLNRDGVVDADDTGTIDLASILATTDANPDGDCILGEGGDDDLRGGAGSDHIAAGAGTDLVVGGDGNDLLLGDAGTDVVLGGPHDDVLVGGADDDLLIGGEGDDRLRGNDGDDDLIGGTDTAKKTDGQDVLLGGRGQDVLAGENASLISVAITEQIAGAPWKDASVVPAGAGAGADSELRFADSAVTCGSVTEATRWVTLLAGGDETRDPVASPGGPKLYDELFGGFGCDWVFGQEGDDLVRGGQGDDVVEAGSGADVAYGDAGDDVVIGGSSVDQDAIGGGPIVLERSGEGVTDGDDTLYGDGGPGGAVGDDVLLGDNATPIRTPRSGGSTNQVLTSFAGEYDVVSGLAVAVVLADLLGEDDDDPDTGLFGDDTIVAAGGDDLVFGQSGDDVLEGGDGDDYLEGNAGDDYLEGNAGDDDLLGGSSASDGRVMGADGQRLHEDLAPGENGAVDESADGLLDGADELVGGAGHDVLLGDNGRITRPGTTPESNTADSQPVRDVAMADVTPGATSGSDTLRGGDGDDVLYGQLDDSKGEPGDGDELDGGAGVDVLLGDLAVVELTPAADLGDPETLELRTEIISEDIYVEGTLIPVTYTVPGGAEVGGSDIAYGGAGDDVLRLGGGDDLANGGPGDDAVFGGAGDDVLWGGEGEDRLFGGYGADLLDVKPRDGDPALFTDVAPSVDTDDDPFTTNDADLAYGGWGPDELQADVGAGGPQPVSDHLVDWVGAHNLYYVCDGPYGAGRVIRQSSPAMRSLLTELVVALGATDIDVEGSGGWFDLGLVDNQDNNANSSPNPDTPGNFTCEEGP